MLYMPMSNLKSVGIDLTVPFQTKSPTIDGFRDRSRRSEKDDGF